MKPQEVLHEISVMVYRNTDDFEMRISKDCYKGIITALEKQIPEKPIKDEYRWAVCPVCGGSVYLSNVREHILNKETTYCEHCGQKLDWSDTE